MIDRTLVCRTGAALGTRSITVSAQSGARTGDWFESLAQAFEVTPGQPVRNAVGRIAVPSRAGMQLAYMDVFDSGRARFFTARRRF